MPRNRNTFTCQICGRQFESARKSVRFCSRSCIGEGNRKPRGRTDPMERFWAKVNKTDGCWLWTAGIGRGGYGQFNDGTRHCVAHRWLYQQIFGPLADDIELHHRCETPACVNPDHLVPLTHAEHMRVSPNMPSHKNAQRTHCNHGHPFDEANTAYSKKNGSRICRACCRESTRRYRERNRLERVPRTHCKYGHPWDEANTAYNSDGYRYCKACRREHSRQFRERKELAA